MNPQQRFLYLVVIKEKYEGQDRPDVNRYFDDAKQAKVFAQENTRYLARHSWRKASIKAIPV